MIILKTIRYRQLLLIISLLLVVFTVISVISAASVTDSSKETVLNEIPTISDSVDDGSDGKVSVFAIETDQFDPQKEETSAKITEIKVPNTTTVKAPETTQKPIKNESKYPLVTLYINNKQLNDDSYLIDNTVYVPLQSYMNAVDKSSIQVTSGVAVVKSDTMKMTLKVNSNYIEANGRYLYSGSKIRLVDDTIYVPFRLLAKAYGLNTEWKASTMKAYMSGTVKALKSGSQYYDSDEVYWLSRIINAESGGESLVGKIAVGNVVLNRVQSKDYPDTIYGVIFDKKYGTQFSPVSYGTIYNTPNEDSIIAAKICLDGYSLNNEMIFFINPKIATNFWITDTRSFVMKIGNHSFYK